MAQLQQRYAALYTPGLSAYAGNLNHVKKLMAEKL